MAAAVLWATLGIAGKTLYAAGAQPLAVIGWRAIIAAVILLAVLAVRAPRRLRIPLAEAPFFALFGLAVAGNYACYFLSLQRVPVAVAIILLYTYPAFTALAARVLFNERLTRAKAVAIALSFVGIVLVAGGGRGLTTTLDGLGFLLGLGAGLTMAAYALMGKRASARHSPWTTAFYSFAFAALWLAVARGSDLMAVRGYSPAMWGGLLYLGAGPTLLAYGLFLWAIGRLEVSRAGVWTTLEPPIAALLAFAVLGESISPVQVLGSGVVLLGVVILQRRSPPRPGEAGSGPGAARGLSASSPSPKHSGG